MCPYIYFQFVHYASVCYAVHSSVICTVAYYVISIIFVGQLMSQNVPIPPFQGGSYLTFGGGVEGVLEKKKTKADLERCKNDFAFATSANKNFALAWH